MGKILKNLSILQKFLFINLVVFIFIIIITFFYLGAIQTNLINEKQKNHTNIITQTILNLEKSNIKLNEYGISEFLFSKKSRFPYFEKLDRVIFFDDKLNWIGDTRSIPSSTLLVEELTQQSGEDNFNNQENKNKTKYDQIIDKFGTFNNYVDQTPITCKYKKDTTVYIDFEMNLWPCNHIAATKQEDMTHYNKLEKEYGVGWNNLEQHTAEQIFYHEYFQSILPLTWKDPSHKLCTYECQEMCGGGLHSKAWEASTNREEL